MDALKMPPIDHRGRPLAADGLPLGGLATVAEVATVTGLSNSTIRNHIQDGVVPHRRFGRSIRVAWADVRKTYGEPQ